MIFFFFGTVFEASISPKSLLTRTKTPTIGKRKKITLFKTIGLILKTNRVPYWDAQNAKIPEKTAIFILTAPDRKKLIAEKVVPHPAPNLLHTKAVSAGKPIKR